ncbi:MAG: hypothetical protein WBN82_13495 [Porticoccaceae bacterium]|jgi:hypothetical protein
MITRHVETLFCDDIRHEMGGKLSYIGVYSGSLFVQAFPVTLAKLCLSVKIVTPADQPLRSLKLRVLKNEDVLQEIVVDEEQLAAASDLTDDSTEEPGKERVHVTQFMLVFSPIEFDGPCIFRVLAQTEDGEYSGIALQVDQALPPTELIGGG